MGGKTRAQRRTRRHRSLRLKVRGNAERPRLNVFRSLSQIYAQVVDDGAGTTLAAASTLDEELKPRLQGLSKVEQAKLVGQAIAERAKGRGLSKVVFDRGGYRYHGRVKALAEGAREGGLEF
jgi:large subunit ribosomal protein L18